MRISNGFFVIEGARKVDSGALQLKGHLLADVVTEIEPGDDSGGSTGGSSGKLPPIAFPPRFQVKWILLPEGNPLYSTVKSFAEQMGYETVEHDDFSYPGGR